MPEMARFNVFNIPGATLLRVEAGET